MKIYQDPKTNKKSVVKNMPLSHGLNALRIYKSLNVNAIPTLMDYEICETHLNLKLSYIEGQTLFEFSKTENWLLAIDIVIKNAFLSLLDIHQAGFLHRDIKPENIIVGRNFQVYFIDLDHAILKSEIKEDLSFVGTLKYMSPETLYTPLEVDERSDYFSMASCFFELLKPYANAMSFEVMSYLCEMMSYSKDERPSPLMNWLKKM